MVLIMVCAVVFGEKEKVKLTAICSMSSVFLAATNSSCYDVMVVVSPKRRERWSGP